MIPNDRGKLGQGPPRVSARKSPMVGPPGRPDPQSVAEFLDCFACGPEQTAGSQKRFAKSNTSAGLMAGRPVSLLALLLVAHNCNITTTLAEV